MLPSRYPTIAGWLTDRGPAKVIIAAFVVLNLAIFFLADPSCYQVRGSCALVTDRNGYLVVEALMQHGSLVDYNDPSLPYTAHAPGYALIMAATFLVFGSSNYFALVILQLLLLAASGLLLRRVTELYLPGWGDLSLALLLFNPNAVAQVHLVQTNAMEIFFVTAAFTTMAIFCRQPRLSLVLLCGLALGVAMLVRPLSQFLALILPVLIPLLVVLGGQPRLWRRAVVWGLLGAAMAGAVGTPWMWHMYNSGQSFRMSGIGHEHLLFLDSLKYLTPEAPGTSIPQVKKDYRAAETEHLSQRHANWEALTSGQQDELRLQRILEYYKSFPFEAGVFATALAYSWGRFLVAGGAGEIHRLFGLEYKSEAHPTAFYGSKTAALICSVLLRLLGILGFIVLLRRREFGLLLLCSGLIAMFMAGTFLVGTPRYRVSIEPQLMLFAVFGVAYLTTLFQGRKAGAEAS